jgi:hypothetical protein
VSTRENSLIAPHAIPENCRNADFPFVLRLGFPNNHWAIPFEMEVASEMHFGAKFFTNGEYKSKNVSP